MAGGESSRPPCTFASDNAFPLPLSLLPSSGPTGSSGPLFIESDRRHCRRPYLDECGIPMGSYLASCCLLATNSSVDLRSRGLNAIVT